MTSRSETGRARINLEFAIGTNMDRALLLVANRLIASPAIQRKPTSRRWRRPARMTIRSPG